MYISASCGSLVLQSESFDANPNESKGLFRLVASLAFLAAKRALRASNDFSIIIFALAGFSNKYASNLSLIA